jgi:hypothetical protein
MIWAYRESGGKVERALVSGKKLLRGEPRPDLHFSETVLKGYYQQECDQGSRFHSGYSKSQIKKVHSRALERFQQLGQES